MKQKICSFCDKPNKITKEHVVSKSVIKKLKINQSPGYEHSQGKYTTNNSTIKDVCEKCNNGPLSELDDYFIDFVNNNLPLDTPIQPNSAIELEFDFDKLSRWLLKTLYNSERKNGYEEVEKKLLHYKDYILGKEICNRPLRVFLEVLYDVPSNEIQKFNENIVFLKHFVKVGNIAFIDKGRIDYIKQFTIGNFMFHVFVDLDENKNNGLVESLLDFYDGKGIKMYDLNLTTELLASNRSIVNILGMTQQGNKTFVDYEMEIKRLTKQRSQ